MSCKGICIRYKPPSMPNRFRYYNGQKRCQICEVFLKWNGLMCPCCGIRLRGRPRNLRDKTRFKAMNS